MKMVCRYELHGWNRLNGICKCKRDMHIDSEINHKRHFIKIPFINKGIEFIDLPSIFKDRSVPFIDTCLFPKF